MKGKTLGIVGYGNQARAWAANLREQGWEVTIFLREGSSSLTVVSENQYNVDTLGPTLTRHSTLAILIPDDAISQFATTYSKHLAEGQQLIFAHGFNLHFRTALWPKNVDTILVAPKGIATAVRQNFQTGSGVPAVLAVEQNYTGKAWKTAEDVAEGIGSKRVGIYRATVKDEVEADLFSEQALLCGGLPSLVSATYDRLVKEGISPEVAYLECVHELGFMVDLLRQRGISEMLRFASPTAQFGGVEGGERLISPDVQAELKSIFDDIRSGRFAKELGVEAKEGFQNTRRKIEVFKMSALEKTGKVIREKLHLKDEQI